MWKVLSPLGAAKLVCHNPLDGIRSNLQLLGYEKQLPWNLAEIGFLNATNYGNLLR